MTYYASLIDIYISSVGIQPAEESPHDAAAKNHNHLYS